MNLGGDLRVYAIQYALRDGVAPAEVFHHATAADTERSMAYYVWLIAGSRGAVLVDTGFDRAIAKRRGREQVLRGDPLDALAALGAPAADLDEIILTHLHFDHCGGLDRFPNALVRLQRREMEFWTGPAASRPSFRRVVEPEDVTGVVVRNLDGRVLWSDGDETLAPGVSVHRVGGHTAGLQVVRVETGRGVVVLASDASHYEDNLTQDRPYSAVDSVSGAHAAFDRLRALAGPDGHIIPGHDPAVMARYPDAAAGLEGVAVELTGGPVRADR
ncbi:Beta-lactamase class B [Frankia canadensis]|uniref:Beta-lactamase class B n=1 Tax=Frankia canadensis TaxID=1836972 RepID=A0A2I2KV34_9ACTN|nr:N-acyl homoserine lactonase family protein [Frankia canadensis]SNQ49527.1 Beta-lactamase class B [Frankia canadensis]SOU56817.1 Beta-lactamase class B [Frankia canadensis]